MDESTLIRDRTITAHKDVISDRLPEHLDLEDIGDDLLCLSVNVGVDERDVVVTCDDVAESWQTLFDSLDRYGIWEGVAEVLEFLVGCCWGDEETMTVAYNIGYRIGLNARSKQARDVPAVNRPMILVPPMLVWTMGTTSPNSLSNAE
jgi:hypothetical protein